jgi:hypothetical protein
MKSSDKERTVILDGGQTVGIKANGCSTAAIVNKSYRLKNLIPDLHQRKAT